MLVQTKVDVVVVELEAELEAEVEDVVEDEDHHPLQLNLLIEDEAAPEDAVVVGPLLHLELVE